MRLFDYLREQGLSNRDMRLAFESGRVYLDDIPTADGGRDVTQHRVSVRPNAPRVVVGRDPVVLFHDATLAVVYKPSGLLSVPAVGRRGEHSVISFVKRIFGEGLAVHRLDEGTSGLMVVARTERMQEHLREDLARREISRRYLAIVRHTFGPSPCTFDNVLVRNRGDGKRGTLSEEASGEPADAGKRAVTHVQLLETLARDASLVEAQLETGRQHQVRIHLSEAGFPVLGDDLYGGSRHIASASPRLALHAWRLAFTHPASGEPMEFVAPLADDLEKLRRALNEPTSARRMGSGQMPRRHKRQR